VSDLVKRLRAGPYDRFDPRKDQELEAAARIEALERENAELRKLRAALAPALCPTSDPSWPESQPCSVCGAFGPWFDTPQIGECVEATRTARAPEQDK